ENLSAATGQPGAGQRPGHSHLPDPPAHAAGRRTAPADPQLQRLDCADSPTRALWTGPLRAAAQRPRGEFLTHAARDGARRRNSITVWRQDTADHGQFTSALTAIERTVPGRYRHSGEPTKPGAALRHDEARPLRI